MRRQLDINLRYCYLARRATQTMSASRSLPAIDLKRVFHYLKTQKVTVAFQLKESCSYVIITS